MKKKSNKIIRSSRLYSFVRTSKLVYIHDVDERHEEVHPPQPDEEVIRKLNEIAREYPFCVSYKEKSHDPL